MGMWLQMRRSDHLNSMQALESLPALMSATDMLVCGEDLGMVPSCVHPVLRRLGLLGACFCLPFENVPTLFCLPTRERSPLLNTGNY